MRRWLWALLFFLLPCAAMGEGARPLAEAALHERVVYLTFDDGPNEKTPELLALLDQLDVPATFFLKGCSVKRFPENAKRILDAGHAIGCHTMEHNQGRLAESTDYVRRGYKRFLETMQAYVDPDFTTGLYRFPGGSTSYPGKTKRFVRDMGVAWFDWNGQNSDAERKFSSNQEMIDHTIRSIGKQDVVIMLMHEGKTRTRHTLATIVQYLREQGYEFRVLSTGEEDRAILSRCGANMMLPEIQGEEGN